MKKLLLTAFISFWAMVCFAQTDQPENFSTDEFILTPDTQIATFRIDVNWVGGGGTMPILKPNWRPKKVNGMDVYFDEDYSKQVDEKLPGCWKGRVEIIIKAKIYLERKTVSISSNPPGTRMIYEAKVVDLIDITAKTTPCSE